MWVCVLPIRMVCPGTPLPSWGHTLGGTVSMYSTGIPRVL